MDSSQLLNLSLQLLYLCLLLFDRIEHCPENRIAMNYQITARTLSHRFWDKSLQRLSAESDVLAIGLQLEHIVFLLCETHRLQSHNRA